jgi:hypothetical protein
MAEKTPGSEKTNPSEQIDETMQNWSNTKGFRDEDHVKDAVNAVKGVIKKAKGGHERSRKMLDALKGYQGKKSYMSNSDHRGAIGDIFSNSGMSQHNFHQAIGSHDKIAKLIKDYHGTKNKMNEEAQDTIKMHPSAASKAGMMAQTMNMMAGMSNDECSQWLSQALAVSASHVKNAADNSDKNRSSVAMKGSAPSAVLPNMASAVKEDIEALFGSDELSEEFKTKTTVLFEAAVNARVIAEAARLEEEFETRLEEEVGEITDVLVEQVDQYLSYAAVKWMEENQVAIESTLKNELAEEFMTGLRDLFAEHYLSFPEEQVDAVSALAEKVQALESKLNDTIEENMELSEVVESYAKQEIFDQVTEGLALTQTDKLQQLSEGVAFDGNVEEYKNKLEIIKERHFGVKSTPSMINEQVDDEQPVAEVRYMDPSVASYAKAISRTVKK